MDDCFNFESQYRTSRNLKMLAFQASDGTQWTLTEEWLVSQRRPRTPLQRLIFTKENHYDRHYFINLEIMSVNNRASGKLKVVARSKRILTKIVIPLDQYKIFRFSSYQIIELYEIQLADRLLEELFRYKVTINRAYVLEREKCATEIPPTNRLLVFSEQILSLLETGTFSDVVITDGHSQIRAHRNILSARSSYFRCMFHHGMRESKDGVIYIADTDIRILHEMLRYIYSGILRPVDVLTAYELFVAADKYDIPELKKACTDVLGRHIDVGNALLIYELAHNYHDETLKLISEQFMAEHFEEMQSSNSLSLLATENPALLDELEALHEAWILSRNEEPPVQTD